MRATDERKPGTYYFSASNTLDARGRNVETPAEPIAVRVLDGDHVRWPDGMVTWLQTVWGRLSTTPAGAMTNTAFCIKRQDYQ